MQERMRIRTLAHLSDLHIGLSPVSDAAAAALVDLLIAHRVDHVVVTGDITHRGRASELERFRELFAPLLSGGRVTVVPGNHDRLGDDVSADIMPGGTVSVAAPAGLHLVQLDSSGPHNRAAWLTHGSVDGETIDAVVAAFDAAPPDRVAVLLLHHHLLPLPEESPLERLAAFLGWPHVGELDLGEQLLLRLRGRCDLVLHGHRHRPHAQGLWKHDARPLEVYNAGSSTALGRVRLFSHGGGLLARQPVWLDGMPAAVLAA